MRPFQKMLVLAKGDPLEAGLVGRAAALAAREGGSLELAAAVEPFPWLGRLLLPDADSVREALLRRKAESLEILAGPPRERGLRVSTSVLQGRPYLEAIRRAVRGGHSLLLKEADPRAGSPGLGTTDLELLRNCPCPVWLVRGEPGGRRARVLVPVDPTPTPDPAAVELNLEVDPRPEQAALNVKLLTLAGVLAEADGAEVHVLHAWSAPGESLLRGDVRLPQDQVDRYVSGARDEAERALQKLVDSVPDPTGRRRVHLVKGSPAEVIPEFARNLGADLIVMGTVARTGIPGFLIGNTAETVLQQVDASVLAVKPDGFVSPVSADAASA
ncbi:MAG: universal stress protein [Isosphaeraceae bacterium]